MMRSFIAGMLGAAIVGFMFSRIVAPTLPCDGGFFEGMKMFFNVRCR